MIKVKVSICDGSCLFNPGPGGWCNATIDSGAVQFVYGFEEKTTNNRMELMAVIELLQSKKSSISKGIIYTDSKYVVDGISKWIYSWKKNGWKNAKKEPVKNEDLWKILDEQSRGTEFRWMKGHDIPTEEVEVSNRDIFTHNPSDMKNGKNTFKDSLEINSDKSINNNINTTQDYKKNLLIRIQNQVDLFARNAAEKKLNGSTSIDLKQFEL